MSRESSPLRGRVVFLVGVRRSGTNWLRRIVDAHPDASVIPGETYLLSHGIAPLAERVQHGLAGSALTGSVFVDRDEYLDAVRQLCDRILGGYLATLDRPGKLIAERTPDHVRFLDLVADIYPDAAVVHIVRDGRDVSRSLVSQPWGPTSYTDAATEWVSGIEAARAVAPRLTRYLEVSYEELLADPVQHVPALYRFLGLDDDPVVVHQALLEAEVPYNVDPASRALTAAKWRDGLEPGELAEVQSIAGPLLSELGYHESGDEPGVTTPARKGVRRRVASLKVPSMFGDRGQPDQVAFQQHVLDRLKAGLELVQNLMEDVVARKFDDLDRHFAPDARIRVVHGDHGWDARGPAAVAQLADHWRTDVATAGRQLRADVHPGVPSFTIISTWETPAGSEDRLLVVTRHGSRIDELTWYVLPRAVGSSGSAESAPAS